MFHILVIWEQGIAVKQRGVHIQGQEEFSVPLIRMSKAQAARYKDKVKPVCIMTLQPSHKT